MSVSIAPSSILSNLQPFPSSTIKPFGLTVITVPLPPASLKPSDSLKVLMSPYSPPPLKFTTVIDESGIISAPLTVIIDLPITVLASAEQVL